MPPFTDRILKANVPLTDEDWMLIKRHPQQGARVVSSLDGYGPLTGRHVTEVDDDAEATARLHALEPAGHACDEAGDALGHPGGDAAVVHQGFAEQRAGADGLHVAGHHGVDGTIERTIAWLTGYRRLTIRYERHGHLFAAFLQLAAALTCYKKLPT